MRRVSGELFTSLVKECSFCGLHFVFHSEMYASNLTLILAVPRQLESFIHLT